VLALPMETLSDFGRDFTILPGAIYALPVADRKIGGRRSGPLPPAETGQTWRSSRYGADICGKSRNIGLEAVSPIQAVAFQAVAFQAVAFQAVAFQAVAFQAVAAIEAVSASHGVLLCVTERFRGCGRD
jgi:hypothetical protein